MLHRTAKPAGGAEKDKGRFPLPDGFFREVVCTPDEIVALTSMADRRVNSALDSVTWEMQNEDVAQGWKLTSSKRLFRESGIRTYCRRVEVQADRQTRRLEFKCLAHTAMPLDTVMSTFYSDTTAEYREKMAFLLSGCLDATVLRVIERRAEATPYQYLGLNWVAMRSPGLITRKRDFCVTQSTGMVVDPNNGNIGYLFARSTNLPECPSLKRSHGVVRTGISLIALFRDDPRKVGTQVVLQGTIKMGSSALSSIISLVQDSFAACIASLNSRTAVQKLPREPSNLLDAQPKRDKKSCHICGQHIPMFRRHHCGICGETTCKRCEFYRNATPLELNITQRIPSILGSSKAHFCRNCVMATQDEPPVEDDLPRRDQEARTTPRYVPQYASDIPRASEQEDEFDRYSERDRTTGSILWQWDVTTPGTSRMSTRSCAELPAYRPMSNSVPTTSMMCSSPSAQSWDGGSVLSASESLGTPLSIQVAREWRTTSLHSRLWEEEGSTVDESSEAMNSPRSQDFSHSGGKDSDIASRLFEMQCKAQEALDTVKRNSILMGSDTSSQPRTSDVTFQSINESIAEQAEMLNMIGLVSRGRVYMETGEDDCGVRMSQSSSGISDDERFEILA